MIRLGTRGSALALAQARWVAERLQGEVEIVPITTSGDTQVGAGAPRGTGGRRGGASEVADKARFVKEIEEALLAGDVDLAVHSAKDVPARLPAGCSIVGVPERADPRDTLCGAASLNSLSEGASVGTSSIRRRSQLLARRPDLEIRELRGNVDTRLRRLADGDFEAIVLAAAGLARLDRSAEGVPMPADELVPAAGQGCLALEARGDDERMAAAAATVTDREAQLRLTAERALVSSLDATCDTPLGAVASVSGDKLRLTAYVGAPDGSHWIRDELDGGIDDPSALGAELAERLLTAGARELL